MAESSNRPPLLYLNHDVHKVAAKVLRAEGYDVVATGESGKENASDEDQVRYAATQQRALVSFNLR